MSFTIEQKYLLRLILTVFAIASAGCLAAETSHVYHALAPGRRDPKLKAVKLK